MVDKATNIMSLYKSNYLAQHHTREMAKLIKKSHVTLLPYLRKLEKDKILIAKKIGKNKVYSLNFDNILTKSYILLPEIVWAMSYLKRVFLVKKITEGIFELNLSGTLILFGSYAKQTFKEESDIDIFYIGKIIEEEIQEIKKIGKTYGKIINIKNSSLKNFESGLREKNPLIIEIIKNHILLQNPELFINTLWRYYNDIRGS